MLSCSRSPGRKFSESNGDGSVNAEEEDNTWRERVGVIQNAELLTSWDHAVSSSDDEEGGDKSTAATTTAIDESQLKAATISQKSTSAGNPSLRRDARHVEDFFLVGPNAWLLLKQKFGTGDAEICCQCVFHTAEESTIAVSLDRPTQQNGSSNDSTSTGNQGRLLSIPPGGYFAYAKMVEELEGDSQEESFLSQQAPAQSPSRDQRPGDLVSDEEGDTINDLVCQLKSHRFL